MSTHDSAQTDTTGKVGGMSRVIDMALRDELDQLVANMCKALNDSKRLLVMYALSDGPHTVTELCELLETQQSNTSQHLAVLRSAGMVDTERRGNSVLYSLRHPEVISVVDQLRGIMARELDRRSSISHSAQTS